MMRARFKAAGKGRRPAARIALLAAAVALLALTLAGPVVAKPAAPPKAKARPFMVQAIVTSVDTTGTAFTAKVVKGNHAMKVSKGQDVTFAVGASTVIVKINKEGATLIGLGDLVVGDRVLINGRIERIGSAPPVFKARLIRDRGPAPIKT